MPEVETPVAPAPVLNGLPDNVVAALPKVAADFDVDKFFPAEKKAEPVVPAKPAVVAKEVVSGDDAPPAPKTLGQQLAAKAKPPAAPVTPAVEPAKVDVPAAVVNPEDGLELDGKASSATRENFKTLKTVTKTLRGEVTAAQAKAAELQTKLEAASKAPSATETAELTRLRDEHKALSDRLLLIDTKNHPAFKAQYEAPKQAAIAAAKELLGDKDVSKLLDLPRAELGKALSELTKDLPDLDRRDVQDNLYNAWKLEQGGREALAKAGETHGAIRQKTVEEQKEQFNGRFQKIVPGLAEHIVKLEVPVNASAQERESITAYNDAVLGIRASAEKVALGSIDEDAIVGHAAKSAAYDFHVGHVMPRLGREMADMQEVISGLQKELAMYHGKNPKRDISAPSSERSAPAVADSIESLADAHFAKR